MLVGVDLLGERQEVLRVAIANMLRVAALVEPLDRVGPNRFEHREARFTVGLLLLAEKVVVDERRDSRQDTPRFAH